MSKYMCKICGYQGDELIFQFTDYTYCIATNDDEPEYIKELPDWVKNKCFGNAEIGEPVGCPKCKSWGVSNFIEIY